MLNPLDDDLDDLKNFWALDDTDFGEDDIHDEMTDYEGDDYEDDEDDEEIGGSDALEEGGWL